MIQQSIRFSLQLRQRNSPLLFLVRCTLILAKVSVQLDETPKLTSIHSVDTIIGCAEKVTVRAGGSRFRKRALVGVSVGSGPSAMFLAIVSVHLMKGQYWDCCPIYGQVPFCS